MRFSDAATTAYVSLRHAKMRTLLTMLGIVIGIASVILMMSLGSSAENLIVGQINSIGSNNIYIEPGAPEGVGFSESFLDQMSIKTLKAEDAEAIAKDPLVEAASPMIYSTGRVSYGSETKKLMFMGVTASAYVIDNWHAEKGRDIDEADVRSFARVVTLGKKTATDLFGQEDPLGKTMQIKNITFRVIGVMEERGMQIFQNFDEYIYLPLTTAQKLLVGIDHLNAISVKAKTKEAVPQAVDNIRELLRERHNIYNPNGDLSKDDFKVMSQVATANMLTQITGVLTAFLSSIAAIALIVGGIGIMNIMLVSVTERTREIGLRKAVGATTKDIRQQFLLEAVVLTVSGGLAGLVLGIGINYLIYLVLSNVLDIGWNFSLPLAGIILAVGVSTLAGLVFGLYPASQAAKKSPIEALRYE